jgi:hypothetical protein
MEQVHTSSQRTDRAGFEPSLQGAAEEARRGVQNLGEASWRWIDEFLESRRDAAVEELGSIASALRSAARSFGEQQRARAAQFADTAAERIDTFSDRLRRRDPRQLLEPLQELARRQPALLLGGALAAGFLLARVLRGTGAEPSDLAAAEDARHDLEPEPEGASGGDRDPRSGAH